MLQVIRDKAFADAGNSGQHGDLERSERQLAHHDDGDGEEAELLRGLVRIEREPGRQQRLEQRGGQRVREHQGVLEEGLDGHGRSALLRGARR